MIDNIRDKGTDSSFQGGLKDIDLYTFLYAKMQVFFAAHSAEVPPRNVYRMIIVEVERALLDVSLEFCDGNKSMASQVLGIDRNTLQAKLKKCCK